MDWEEKYKSLKSKANVQIERLKQLVKKERKAKQQLESQLSAIELKKEDDDWGDFPDEDTQAEMEDLKKTIEQLNEEKKELEKNVSASEEKSSEFKQSADMFRAKFESLKMKVEQQKEVEKHEIETQTPVGMSQEEIEDLQNTLFSTEQNLHKMNEKMEAFLKEKASLEHMVEEMKKENEKLAMESESKIESLQDELEKAKKSAEEMEDLKERIENLQEELKCSKYESKKNLEKHKKMQTEFDLEIISLKNEIENKTEEVNALIEERKQDQKVIITTKEKLESIQAEYTRSIQKSEERKTLGDKESSDAVIMALEKKVATVEMLEKEVETLQKDLEMERNENEILLKKLHVTESAAMQPDNEEEEEDFGLGEENDDLEKNEEDCFGNLEIEDGDTSKANEEDAFGNLDMEDTVEFEMEQKIGEEDNFGDLEIEEKEADAKTNEENCFEGLEIEENENDTSGSQNEKDEIKSNDRKEVEITKNPTVIEETMTEESTINSGEVAKLMKLFKEAQLQSEKKFEALNAEMDALKISEASKLEKVYARLDVLEVRATDVEGRVEHLESTKEEEEVSTEWNLF